MKQPLLETEGVTVQFGGLLAVDDVHLRLNEGEIRCIIGPNGAGKSTFFHVVAGSLVPTRGRIRFEGRDVTGAGPVAISRLGLVRTYQQPRLFQTLTVRENVRLAVHRRLPAFHPFRLPSQLPDNAQVDELLERFGLTDRADLPAGDLPHGSQKRLEMATGMACKPKVLLLDEPTAGMTIRETAEMATMIKAMASEVTMVVIEHDIRFVKEIADQITVFNRGRVLTEGSPAEIENHEAVREIYLGSRRH